VAYTNFCCRSGGNNLNAGTRKGDTTEPGTAPSFAYNGTFATDTFTVTSGAQGGSTTNPQADGVVAGDFVHVSNGAVGRIARVASVTTTTIVLDTTATVGSGTGATLANVGGAWAGPSGATGFPIGTLTNAVTNTSGNNVRINLKNNQTYSISAFLSSNQAAVSVQGYSSSYGDFGKATIDASTNAISLYSQTGAGTLLADAILQNNGASGINAGIAVTAGALTRVVVNTVRGAGISVTGTVRIEECETYACNSANSASSGGVLVSGSGIARISRCTIHDNVGSNSNGLVLTGAGPVFVKNTIFDSNENDGVLITATSVATFEDCDFYNNGRDGIESTATQAQLYSENSNFIKNGRYGAEQAASTVRNWFIVNAGYGAGTAANASGTTSGANIQETGAVTYASNVTPWVDPANGDFRINLAAAKGAGRGTFTETAASYTGTVGYPDIGAAQHIDPASGGSFAWVG